MPHNIGYICYSSCVLYCYLHQPSNYTTSETCYLRRFFSRSLKIFSSVLLLSSSSVALQRPATAILVLQWCNHFFSTRVQALSQFHFLTITSSSRGSWLSQQLRTTSMTLATQYLKDRTQFWSRVYWHQNSIMSGNVARDRWSAQWKQATTGNN